MNYREKMRKAVECPQFGNINYGEWGTLRLDQRNDIKRLLDEMDRADEVIKHQFFEIERLNNIIKRLEEDLREMYLIFGEFSEEYTKNRIKELKGEDKE